MRIITVGLNPDLVDYEQAWQLQREHHQQVVAGGEDRVLLLEHPPTFTAGKRTLPQERPADGTPVIEVDRGGKITWHGPGQIVGYPILRLPDPLDVVAYVRRIEDFLIAVCADTGVNATTVEGRSGAWILGDGVSPERKIAAIGIRVARGVTMHGFSLNVNCDLSWAQNVVACGIADAGVTSLQEVRSQPISVAQVLPHIHERLPALIPTKS